MDTTRYVSVTFKKGLLIEGGLHPQCSQGEVLSQDEYVKYSDVEKAVKLWEAVGIPKNKSCDGCACRVIHQEGCYCGIFSEVELYYQQGKFMRCQQCIDIFGGE